MKNVKTIVFTGFLVLIFNTISYSQGTLTPAQLRYQFNASSADSCGFGGIGFYGYQTSQTDWSVNGRIPNTYFSGGYLAFSWTLTDETGGLASGSYDSRTNISTGGTYGGSWSFTMSRIPAGELRFQASGQVRGQNYSGQQCEEAFNATTYTGSSSGGYLYLGLGTPETYVFQSKQDGLALQIKGSSPQDYQPATKSPYNGTPSQWTLTVTSGENTYNGYYKFTNNVTNKPLYSDFQSGNPAVYQLSNTSRGWRFISVGDGSYYIVYDQFVNGRYVPYAMQPIGGTLENHNDINVVEKSNQLSQQWYVMVVQ